jgi:outer membrane protein TolC
MMKKTFLTIFLFSLTLIAYNQTHNLRYYLDEAVKNSPLLKDYGNQYNSALTDSQLINAAHKPLVEARSQLQYSPAYHSFGYDEVITDGGLYTAVLGISQTIFNRKTLDNKYKSVEIQKNSVNNSVLVSKKELIKIITDQYLTAYSGYTDFMFNKSFLDLFHKENEIVSQFVKNGIAKQTDYLALLLESQNQEILVSQTKGQYIKELMILNQLCGLTDTTFFELPDPQLGITGTADITRLPAYLQYRIDSILIENEKLAIDLQYKPKLNWFADAGFLSSTPWNFYQHFGYSAGISLNIPVYDGKQKNLAKQKLEFDQNSRSAYENNFRKQYIQQINQLESELKSLDNIGSQLSLQLKTSAQLVAALKDQLEAGIIQMTEYINALKNYKNSGRNINLNNVQKLQVINQMNFLLTK